MAQGCGAGLVEANRKDGDDTASTDVLLLVANSSVCNVVMTGALCFSSLNGFWHRRVRLCTAKDACARCLAV